MTHAGTIDLGGSAQSKQGGSPWAAIAATLALVLAMMGAVWFASNAGLVGGTAAKPVEDRSYDQIEAHRGATTPITVGALEDRSYDQIEAQRARSRRRGSTERDVGHVPCHADHRRRGRGSTERDVGHVPCHADHRRRDRASTQRDVGHVPCRAVRRRRDRAPTQRDVGHVPCRQPSAHGAGHAGSRRRPLATPSM